MSVAPECREAVYQEVTKVITAEDTKRKAWHTQASVVYNRLKNKYEPETLKEEIAYRFRREWGVTICLNML